MGSNTVLPERRKDENTIQYILRIHGTSKKYSEYQMWLETVAMSTKTNWQAKFKNAKLTRLKDTKGSRTS
jgi:hypothetical protein